MNAIVDLQAADVVLSILNNVKALESRILELTSCAEILQRISLLTEKFNSDIAHDLYPTAIDFARELRTTRETISSISKDFAIAERALKSSMMPFILHCGIQQLPSELLTKIFEYAVSIEPGLQVKLSHVSHGFREICLASPRLWSKLSSFQSPHAVSSYLERSGQTGIMADILDHNGDASGVLLARTRSLTSVIVQSANRLEHLYVDFGYWTGPVVKSLDAGFSALTMERLRSLSLSYDDEADYHEEESRIVFSVSQAPNLRSLTIRNCFPRMDRFGSALKSLTVELRTYFEDLETALSRLLDFLESLTALERLALDVQYTAADGFEPPQRKVALPSVEWLTISFSAANYLPFVEAFMTSLTMPKLRDVALSAVIDECDLDASNGQPDFSSLFAYVFPAECDYSSVQSLKLDIENADYSRSAMIDFGTLPGLRTLDISAPFLPFPLWTNFSLHGAKPVPPLEYLRLQECSSVACERLQSLMQLLKEKPEWSSFRRLEVVNCPGLNKKDLEDIVTEERLAWHYDE